MFLKTVNIVILAAVVFSMCVYSYAGDDAEKDELIKEVARRTFLYFWDEANPENGLIPDATGNRNCSNSVVGFGLAAICIAHEQGWITYEEAYDRVLKTLQSFIAYPGNPSKITVEDEHGHHYHWVNIHTGKWIGSEGIYASDTSPFIAGVLTAGEYFKGTEIEKLADDIYRNVDWMWFVNKENNMFYIGWEPATGFGGWYTSSEMGLLPVILGISSPTHPIPVETWFNLGNTFYHASYGGYNYVGDGAAYTHQWPFCFMDPRLKKDYFLDYFQNLREFSLAGRQWCIDNSQMGFGPDMWGLNVCAGPGKYGDYAAPVIPGAPLAYNGRDNDGTIAPTAALSFMPFTPEESYSNMKYIYENFGDKIFKKYGFTDSYNIKKDFWSREYLGIDQGPIIIMLGNYLSGTVWKHFMNNKHIKAGMEKVGFAAIIDNFDESRHSPPYAEWVSKRGDYGFFRQDENVKEGKKALQIIFNKIGRKDFFEVSPLLEDFSPYRYLAFWKEGTVEPKIILRDKDGKTEKLDLKAKVRDGSWELCYYDLSKLRLNLESIDRISFYFNTGRRKTGGSAVIDFVHLSNRFYGKLPPAPAVLEAVTGQNRGDVELKLKLARPAHEEEGNIAAYRIKMSEHPIKDKEDFNNADDVSHMGHMNIGYDDKKLFLRKLEPGKKYFFAAAAENNVYALSDILTAEAEANSKEEKAFALGKKELVDFNVNDYGKASSKDDILMLNKEKGQEGSALGIVYVMKGPEGWHWVDITKKISGVLPEKYEFSFYFKGEGLKTGLEFKIKDSYGCIFGKKIDNLKFDGAWEKVVITSEDIKYWWGGEKSDSIGPVESLSIALSTSERGEGKAFLNKMRLESK
ncbi:hypothetical protein M0R36_03280 [bacterium]|jgi:hypothetical protein|nr:hypothetical protein [bacterium]